MKWFAKSLWDLLPASFRPDPPAPAPVPKPPPSRPRQIATQVGAARRPRRSRTSAQDRYDAVVSEMLDRYEVRVRKWRKSMSGVAWELTYHDGRVKRLIESPKPKSPMSLAIFLHEIGHHAIGFKVYKPRCLEEYHAWAFAVRTMEERGLEVTERVHTRMRKSLKYAGEKAVRRGIKHLPDEIARYMHA